MKKTKTYTFRKFIGDIHLWLGVASALTLFFICLSGTLYVFNKEVAEFLEPEKYSIERGTTIFPLEQLIANTSAETKGKVTRITYSDDAKSPYELQVSKGKEDKRGKTYYVNQYTNTVLGNSDGPSSEFMMTMFKMHRWLLFDTAIGRPIVGISTIIFVILSFSGLIIWLPKKFKGRKSFKAGLNVKFSSNWKRINHDLHNVLGFYSLIFLLIISLTGLNWSFEWYKDGMSTILNAEVFGGRNEKKPTAEVPKEGIQLSVDEIAKAAKKVFVYNGTTTISIPKKAEDPFEVTKKNSLNLNKASNDRTFINAYNASVIKTDYFADKSFGEKIAAQIKPLHTGEIYGLYSKIIYFIVCLIATSLPVTGLIIWINKLNKKSKKRKSDRRITKL